jgi:hypothetical protein
MVWKCIPLSEVLCDPIVNDLWIKQRRIIGRQLEIRRVKHEALCREKRLDCSPDPSIGESLLTDFTEVFDAISLRLPGLGM